MATFNVTNPNTTGQQRSDLTKLLSRDWLDVIGLTEGDRVHTYHRFFEERGWRVTEAMYGGRPREVPVLWRASTFELVSSQVWLMHGPNTRTRYHYPARFTHRVVLRVRATGDLVSVLVTHANQRIERNRRASGPTTIRSWPGCP